jgi:membrane protease subunit (stomatin/prohibitin family)
MSLWDRLTGEFVDVIDWTEDGRDQIVWRFERHGNAIKYGAKLTVREGQVAVFVHEGVLADVFPPGLYELQTNNMPVLTTLQHWDHGFNSPFKSEVYFVSTRRFGDLKWGTKNPILLRDPEFGMVRLRAYGTYAMRVADAARFMTEIVGTDGEVTTDEVMFALRNVIVSRFSAKLAASGIPVLDLAANTDDLARLLRERIAPELAAFGVELPELYIENVSLPPEVEAAVDRRTAMGVVGDLSKYTQFQAADAMRAAADQPGGAAGAVIGMGLGGAAMGPWGAAPAGAGPTPPPPPPPQAVWHVADAGQTRGPFDHAAMQRLAAAGELRPETPVWKPGAAGWAPAGAQPELAALFPPPPPPPPPGA